MTRVAFTVGLGLALVALGCRSAGPAVGPAGTGDTDTAFTVAGESESDALDEFESHGDREARIARTLVPGYAGIRSLGERHYRVYLTDSVSAAAARSYVRELRDEPDATVEISIVRYDAVQLNEWQRMVPWSWPELGAHTTTLGFDPRASIIEVTIDDAGAVEPVTDELVKLGIPADALRVGYGVFRPDTERNPLTRAER